VSFFGELHGLQHGAIAIQNCREIEEVRCEGSATCGVIDSDTVASCKRFYQDQCLHGIFGDTEPTADEEKGCMGVIKDARDLAKSTEGDVDQVEAFEGACTVIASPWRQPECRYLAQQSQGGASSEDEDE